MSQLIGPGLVNALWWASSVGGASRFRRALGRVAEVQAGLLARCLAANCDTEIGERLGFGAIGSVAEFQRRVPLSVYDDYVADIRRIAAGARGVLTRQPVARFEPSSGATAASKLIPYTAALRGEMRATLAAWVHDLFAHDPRLLGGPAYWSVTPLAAPPADPRQPGLGERSPAGIPVGFDQDSDYLGRLGPLVASALAVPDAVKHLREVAAFRYVTLLHLLRARGLRLISVWNPTFLSLLLAPLGEWWEPLLRDLARGGLDPPPGVDLDLPGNSGLTRRLARALAPVPRRARELSRLRSDDHAAIWPRLRLISCWADGPAAAPARELARLFPGVGIQAKGLLATEAFVSFPLAGHEGGVLAATGHFFEFAAPSGEPLLAHQLRRGETYEVIVTTGGGLYRYQLHDLVEVVGWAGQAPCLRFVGKTDRVSDWFGEKLHEGFVAGVLAELFDRLRLRPRFAMVAPEPCPEPAAGAPSTRGAGGASGTGRLRYVLFLELDGGVALPPGGAGLPGRGSSGGSHLEPGAEKVLEQELDLALCRNFHYAYCRRLGQLAPPRLAPVEGAQERYLAACRNQGMRMGDIKPAMLQKATGWSEWLEARICQ